jgi:hypothetical protein
MKYILNPIGEIAEFVPKYTILKAGNYPYLLELHGLGSRGRSIYADLDWLNKQIPHAIVATNHYEINAFVGSLDSFLPYYNEMILKIKRNCIIIGHSLGGCLALFLSQNPYVKKVFAVSTFNSFKFLEKATIMNFVRGTSLAGIFLSDTVYSKFEIAEQKSSFNSKCRGKIHLIHGLGDRDIPASELKANMHDLNIPKSRCLTLDGETHHSIMRNRSMQKWILEKMA